ncbi:hypothetical protein [Flavobacterium restrictum]|uniref:Uncharacterized protein n=1 Tax=Flavobacterium restrictum TaxID=2594428 RepID=A0A553DXY9_9FLAO|nr:hypothetical protein [Flavobacterium restrictum]TRX37523.1 hypothetical protein FNW21_12120 [Flavobacterium restrictum]
MKAFKLDNEPKLTTGFTTPEHYFENFSAKVLLQLPKEETKVIGLFQHKKRIFMAVAAVLILALMIPVYLRYSSQSPELDDVTIENYLTSSQQDMSQIDLISEIERESSTLKMTSDLEDETVEDILVTNSNLEHLILE